MVGFPPENAQLYRALVCCMPIKTQKYHPKFTQVHSKWICGDNKMTKIMNVCIYIP